MRCIHSRVPHPACFLNLTTHCYLICRWFQETGRAGGNQPLWMRQHWHMPELDCPPGRDPQTEVGIIVGLG